MVDGDLSVFGPLRQYEEGERREYSAHRLASIIGGSAEAELALVLLVNGTKRTADAAAGESLLTVLRDRLDLTGTKYGCGEGQCGACTVLLDGRPTRSCLTPAGDAAGKKITTIEGLEENGRLHAVQEAFLKEEAFQCGSCTSGMILGAAALLARRPHPSDSEIVASLQGHICRCGTYPRIFRAVKRAAGETKA
jgi:aerobic-type carbon monoxide dehydrogenase small subunit (CoxS/CutS family)